MWRYVVKRLLYLIPVIIGISFLVFVLMDIAPGDIVDMKIGEDSVLTEEQIADLYAQYGLDKPLLVRYFNYMKGFVLHGDLGKSYTTGEPVMKLYLQRVPSTLKLALASVLVSVVISIPLGIMSAMRRGSLADNAASFGTLLGLSIPNFWLGLVLIIYFALKLHWFPTGDDDGTLKSLILPAITHGTGLTASLGRTTRSSMLDVVRQDYLRTVRAKGASERRVIWGHALKNAMIPILTVVGTQLAAALGGSTITETVFSWPGTGRLLMDSINGRDTPIVTGVLILKVIVISLVMLAVDLLYAAVDPRIRAQYTKSAKRRRKVS